MIDLYTVPLGMTARTFFAAEAEKNYNHDEALLILPSRLLVNYARVESMAQAVNFEYLPNRIIAMNRQLLDLPQDAKLEMISRRTQELLVGDLLRQLAQKQGLDYFVKLAEKEGFVKAVTGLLGQLSRSGATAEEITKALLEWEERNPAYEMKDGEIAALYNLYRAKLKSKNWYDVEGLYRLAIFVLENENVKLPWKHLYFSEFYSFDALQRLLLQSLSRHCKISIGLMYDAKRPEIFGAVEKTYGYLSGFANQQIFRTSPIERPRELQHLLDNFAKSSYLQIDGSEKLQIFEAPDKESELRAVLSSIKIKLKTGAVYSDFLVAVRDFNVYSGIRAICDEYGVPVTLPQTASLSAQPVCEFLRLLLTVADKGNEAIDAYWRLLKCGVTKMLWSFDGEVFNGLKQKKFYNSLKFAKEDVEQTARTNNENWPGDLAIFEEILESVPQQATVAEYGEYFKNLLEQLSLPRIIGEAYRDGKACLSQVKNITETVRQLKEVLDTLCEDYKNGDMEALSLPAAVFCRLLQSACLERSVVLTAADSGGILIGEAANLQGMLFKHVYIIGLREGEFPRSKNENWIYSDRERSYLSSVGIELDTTVASYAEDKFFFAAVASMATESLTLSYYSDDAAGASAYIEDVERLYLKGTLSKQRVARCTLQKSLSEQELLLNLAAKNSDHNWLLERLDFTWNMRSRIEKMRAEGASVYSGLLRDRHLEQAVNNTVGDNFSASKLETYAQCPFRFLISYVWRQQQYAEMTENMEVTNEGNLLHDVLARFLAEHLHEKLTKYQLKELLHQLDNTMTSVCDEYISGGEIVVTDFWPSQRRRLSLLLQRWLKREITYQKEWEAFVPIKVEWDFGRNEGAPLALAVDGGKIYLNGRIDRIDSDGNSLFVTDYKRSVTPAAGDIMAGLDLQMPLYLLAVSALESKSKIIGGGYYSLKEGRRKGGFALQEIGKPPFSINSKLFNEAEDQWQAFEEFCLATVKKYVDKLQSGNYHTAPRKQCPEYCPGKDICRAYGQVVTEGGEENV